LGTQIKQALIDLTNKVAAQKLPALLGSMSAIIMPAALKGETWLAQYIPSPPEIWAARLLALSITLLLLLLVTFFWFLAKLVFDTKFQIYIDAKTGVAYCPSCKDGHKRLAKLIKYDHYWRCCVKECRSTYNDPDNTIQAEPWKPLDPTMGY
jgi:hypothetical protein